MTKAKMNWKTIGIIAAFVIGGTLVSPLYGPVAPFIAIAYYALGIWCAIEQRGIDKCRIEREAKRNEVERRIRELA